MLDVVLHTAIVLKHPIKRAERRAQALAKGFHVKIGRSEPDLDEALRAPQHYGLQSRTGYVEAVEGRLDTSCKHVARRVAQRPLAP